MQSVSTIYEGSSLTTPSRFQYGIKMKIVVDVINVVKEILQYLIY